MAHGVDVLEAGKLEKLKLSNFDNSWSHRRTNFYWCNATCACWLWCCGWWFIISFRKSCSPLDETILGLWLLNNLAMQKKKELNIYTHYSQWFLQSRRVQYFPSLAFVTRLSCYFSVYSTFLNWIFLFFRASWICQTFRLRADSWALLPLPLG